MDEGLINYLKVYEYELYVSCLSTDWTEYERGDGVKGRVFDEELWREIPLDEREQIESEYHKFRSGSFEDEALKITSKPTI